MVQRDGTLTWKQSEDCTSGVEQLAPRLRYRQNPQKETREHYNRRTYIYI